MSSIIGKYNRPSIKKAHSSENILPSLSREHFRPLFRFSTPWYSSCDENLAEPLLRPKENESRCELVKNYCESYTSGNEIKDDSSRSKPAKGCIAQIQDYKKASAIEACELMLTKNESPNSTSSGKSSGNNADLGTDDDLVGNDNESSETNNSCATRQDDLLQDSWTSISRLCQCQSPEFPGVYDDMITLLAQLHVEVGRIKQEYQKILESWEQRIK